MQSDPRIRVACKYLNTLTQTCCCARVSDTLQSIAFSHIVFINIVTESRNNFDCGGRPQKKMVIWKGNSEVEWGRMYKDS